MLHRWEEVPFAVLAPVLALGIAFSLLIQQYSFSALACGAACLLVASAVSWQKDRLHLSFWSVLLSLFLCGIALALAQRDAYSPADIRALLRHSAIPLNELLLFEGCVIEDSIRYGDDLVTTVDMSAFQKQDRWIPSRGKIRIHYPAESAQEYTSMESAILRPGDRLRGWAEWSTPRNFANPGSSDRIGFLNRQGIFLTGKIKSPRLIEVIRGECGSVITALAQGARNKLRKSLSALKNEHRTREAAILSSLLIGDYSGLDSSTREVFQNSGTYHVLVISGLHVSWIAGVLFLFFRSVRMQLEAARVLAALAIACYACMIGFQASISRCLWMHILYLLGQTFFRRAEPANLVLASGFSLLVLRPNWLFDAGFQLSFLSVMAISMTALPVIGQCLSPVLNPLCHTGKEDRMFLDSGFWHLRGRKLRIRWEMFAESCADRWFPVLGNGVLASGRVTGKVLFWVGSMLIVSLSVQIWLEPLLAFHFNRLSWIAPIANLLVVPGSSLVLAAGILAAFLSGVPGPSEIFITAAGQMAAWLFVLAKALSDIRSGWQRCPTPGLPWVLISIAAIYIWSFLRLRRSWIPVLMSGSLLAWIAWAPIPPEKLLPDFLRHVSRVSPSQNLHFPSLSLTFLDVGEGDAIIIHFPDGRIWTLDAGGVRQFSSHDEPVNTFDLGEAVVSRYLWSQWIVELDRIILSHPDLDHAGGIPAVMRNFQARTFWYGESRTESPLSGILSVAYQRHISSEKVSTGNHLVAGGIRVDILNPPDGEAAGSTNNGSVVLRISHDRFSALLTGDLERAGEMAVLLRYPALLKSSLLKVSHHGSRSATSDPFLDRVHPTWAIISVGKNNPFGHPSQEVMNRLVGHRARPLLTSQLGAISIETDGLHYILSSYLAGVLEIGTLPQSD